MRDKFPTFNIYDYKDLKCNFHTHTPRCGHATGEEREYVENAIKAGFEVLGFADHAPYLLDSKMVSRIRMPMEAFEGYVRTIEDLKNFINSLCDAIPLVIGVPICILISASPKLLNAGVP